MPNDLTYIQLPNSTIEAVEKQIALGYSSRIRPSGIQELSNITTEIGTIEAGEIRLGNGILPGSGFSGLRVGYPPFIYENEEWNFVGIENDVLQVGIRVSDGKFLAAAGLLILDEGGITFDISDEPAEFEPTRTVAWSDGTNDIIELSGFEDVSQPGFSIRVNRANISGKGASAITLEANGENFGKAAISIHGDDNTGTLFFLIKDSAYVTIQNTSPNIKFAKQAQFESYIDIKEISVPETPSLGYGRIYTKTDSLPYYKDDSGVEHSLISGGSGNTRAKIMQAMPPATLAATIDYRAG
ncbi:hypothetical protein LCGC14_2474120, partial [marine sediment metagenome]